MTINVKTLLELSDDDIVIDEGAPGSHVEITDSEGNQVATVPYGDDNATCRTEQDATQLAQVILAAIAQWARTSRAKS